MAITGSASYPGTMGLFLTHWDAVNAELGPGGPLVLPGGTTRDQFSSLRDDLVGFAASIQDKINDREIARGTIDISRAALVGRLGEFNRKVRGFLSQSPYVRALPDVPSASAGAAKTLAPLDDMASLWAKINGAAIPGFSPPLLLLDDYAVATFDTELAALKTVYQSLQDADQQLKLERERRNDVQDAAYAAMRDYRAAVGGTFAPDSALVESLPRLTPLPGSTPDKVTASGQWDPATGEAVISWSESSDPNLERYDIRMTPGPTYDTEGDTVVGNVGVGTLEFRTTAGLANPGDVATFRVYVLLTTGNEAGSNDVVITRTT